MSAVSARSREARPGRPRAARKVRALVKRRAARGGLGHAPSRRSARSVASSSEARQAASNRALRQPEPADRTAGGRPRVETGRRGAKRSSRGHTGWRASSGRGGARRRRSTMRTGGGSSCASADGRGDCEAALRPAAPPRARTGSWPRAPAPDRARSSAGRSAHPRVESSTANVAPATERRRGPKADLRRSPSVGVDAIGLRPARQCGSYAGAAGRPEAACERPGLGGPVRERQEHSRGRGAGETIEAARRGARAGIPARTRSRCLYWPRAGAPRSARIAGSRAGLRAATGPAGTPGDQ